MTKAEILKQTGLTEEEFYKKFPTQESFEKFMKGGKLPKAAMGMLVGKAIEKGEQLQGLQAAGLTAAAGAIESATENKNEDTRMFGATASGAARGAASGAMFGPAGMGIGALIGGASGFIQGRQDLRAEALQDQRQAFTENLNEQAENIAKAQVGTDTSGYGVGQMKHGGKVYNLFGATGPYGSSPFYAYGGETGPEYEAEGGEILQSNNLSNVYGQGELERNSSEAVKLKGPSHENGGMPMSTNGEGRIFSDRLKPKGDKKNTFADLADDLTKELGKLEEAEKKSAGQSAKNTSKYMKKDINAKLDALFDLQEAQKAEKEERKAKREFKKGGWIKYPHGGEFGLPNIMGAERGYNLTPAMAEDAFLGNAVPLPEELREIRTWGDGSPLGAKNLQGEDADYGDKYYHNLYYPNRRDLSVDSLLDPTYTLDSTVSDLNDIEDVEMEDEVAPADRSRPNTDRFNMNPDQINTIEQSALARRQIQLEEDQLEAAKAGVPTPMASDYSGNYGIGNLSNYGLANVGLEGLRGSGNLIDYDGDGVGDAYLKRPADEEVVSDSTVSDGTVNQEEMLNQLRSANQLATASAVPAMAYNLYQGLFGNVEQPFFGRSSAMPGGAQSLREAGEYTAYNPAAELAANQAAAGRARAQMGRTGNLAALMQGNIAAGRMEGQGASQVLGGAERMNVQAANRAQDRTLGIRQQLMQDAKQTELFNLQQAMREQDYYDKALGARQGMLAKGLEQAGALGQQQAANKLQMARLLKYT